MYRHTQTLIHTYTHAMRKQNDTYNLYVCHVNGRKERCFSLAKMETKHNKNTNNQKSGQPKTKKETKQRQKYMKLELQVPTVRDIFNRDTEI